MSSCIFVFFWLKIQKEHNCSVFNIFHLLISTDENKTNPKKTKQDKNTFLKKARKR